jgi:hypothetical protein
MPRVCPLSLRARVYTDMHVCPAVVPGNISSRTEHPDNPRRHQARPARRPRNVQPPARAANVPDLVPARCGDEERHQRRQVKPSRFPNQQKIIVLIEILSWLDTWSVRLLPKRGSRACSTRRSGPYSRHQRSARRNEARTASFVDRFFALPVSFLVSQHMPPSPVSLPAPPPQKTRCLPLYAPRSKISSQLRPPDERFCPLSLSSYLRDFLFCKFLRVHPPLPVPFAPLSRSCFHWAPCFNSHYFLKPS